MADLDQIQLPNGGTYNFRDNAKLPLAGGTMSGQIKTSFNSSVATGSYGASAHTIPDLCDELRYSSGVMGSFDLTTSYTKDGVTIPTGWYNFLWIPHRSGGVNGQASGDNCNYGSFIISGMTLSGAFLLRYSGSSISELKNFYDLPTSSDNITKGYLNIHPENNPTLIPFMNNDIAYLLKRGGSAIIKYDGVTKTYDPTNCFDASPSYFSVSSSTETTLTIELTLHRTFTWGNIIYIDFGNVNWRAKDVKFEVMNTSYTGDTWTEKFHTTTNSKGNCYLYVTHTPVGASNAGGGFNKLRYTLTDWNGTDRRISQLGIYNYGSSGLRETFIPKDGGNIYGDIYPNANDGASLGTSNNKFFGVNTNRINGVSVGSSPKFTDTTYALSTSGNNVVLTPSSGSANTITVPYATNAGKVNNLTVQTAVPANAVFTDTKVTQTAITASDNGEYYILMSPKNSSSTETNTATKFKGLYFYNGTLIVGDGEYGDETYIDTDTVATKYLHADVRLYAPNVICNDITCGRATHNIILPHKYSTDEQIVGYWIDDSPIYEKTIQLSSIITIASNSNTAISTSYWSQTAKPIDFKVYRMTQAGYQVGICTIAVIDANGKLTIYNTRQGSLAFDTFTIQYIKT